MAKNVFSEQSQNFPTKEIIEWFRRNRRSFPWREAPSPYAVWVSEVMLQQTRASVVIPYFLRWMQKFPTVHALALADEPVVLKLWEGLGYYSRARRLLAGARQVVQEFGGEIPSSTQDLAKIKGIGPYTIHAIQAFAFQQHVAAVDGNVLRLLSRVFGIDEPIDRAVTRIKISSLAQQLVPSCDEAPFFSEALIELGACVCKRTPICGHCPLQAYCVAWREGRQQTLPRRKPREQIIKRSRWVGVILYDNKIILEKRPESEIMGGLYEFPYVENEIGWVEQISAYVGASLKPILDLKEQSHLFTKYKVLLIPQVFSAEQPPRLPLYTFEEASQLPFSSGHKRIYQALQEAYLFP